MVVDRAQEALAIGFEFLRPDAGELAQRGECGGPRTGHLAQRRIVEDDIGRHLRFFGEFLAQRAKRLEQWSHRFSTLQRGQAVAVAGLSVII